MASYVVARFRCVLPLALDATGARPTISGAGARQIARVHEGGELILHGLQLVDGYTTYPCPQISKLQQESGVYNCGGALHVEGLKWLALGATVR